MKNVVFAALSCFFAASACAEAMITNVQVRQQWPWSEKVTIDYDVVGVESEEPQNVVVTAYDGETPLGELPSAALSGSRYGIAKDGRYRIIFEPAKDGEIVRANLSNFNVKLSLTAGGPDSEVLYKILDLTTGRMTDVSRAELLDGHYGAVETNFNFVGTPALTNVLIWTGVTNDVAYKTSKMVFRKIPAGSFTMGSLAGEGNRNGARETQHPVTLTRDYYLGVFKVTRAQWLQIYGQPPRTWGDVVAGYTNSAYGTYAAGYVFYGKLRGDYSVDPSAGNWPSTANRVAADSLLGRMRSRLPIEGFEFDLPTEAQWEYACRAGTTGPRYDGGSGSLKRLLYGDASVGTRLPNAFGLYDLLGSNSRGEIVLDYSSPNYGTPAGEAVTDPPGGVREEHYVAGDGVHWPRVMRGSNERVAHRNFIKEFDGGELYGCRLALQPEGWWMNGDASTTEPTEETGLSNAARVCLDTRSTPYWHTVFSPSEPGSIALDWPHGATRATLTLTMDGASRVYEITDTAATSYPLPAFDAPRNAEGERVCELTLAYDSGRVLKTTLGIVQGVGERGRVPVVHSAESGKWEKSAPAKGVLPVAAGTTRLTVRGEELPVDGLNGDAGWVAWASVVGENALTRVVDGEETSVTVVRLPQGAFIILR